MMPCSNCGFTHNCLCEQLPRFDDSIQVALLCHPNELKRETNTGKILLWSLPGVQQFEWSRKEPPADLLALIEQHPKPVLLFPSKQSLPIAQNTADKEPRLYIVLDATWQEAKKMWRQSPWLQALSQYHLLPASHSNYSLRRNQSDGNLCTCEVGSELMKLEGLNEQANELNHFLQLYLQVFQADRSGHALKPK
ncbi:DTW domain-containing protein [Vibrio breoganii]|uniref:tRNA-uridine aminocarboxypropyltransferase n=1 Tax=Vibrio breoganii TaxID=553239 RepID=UPI000C84A926|nr:DTW domain-containing protein [Vibrio breoganii]PMG05716.1 DTW domain-containing protein [Vibrio breoganii]